MLAGPTHSHLAPSVGAGGKDLLARSRSRISVWTGASRTGQAVRAWNQRPRGLWFDKRTLLPRALAVPEASEPAEVDALLFLGVGVFLGIGFLLRVAVLRRARQKLSDLLTCVNIFGKGSGKRH